MCSLALPLPCLVLPASMSTVAKTGGPLWSSPARTDPSHSLTRRFCLPTSSENLGDSALSVLSLPFCQSSISAHSHFDKHSPFAVVSQSISQSVSSPFCVRVAAQTATTRFIRQFLRRVTSKMRTSSTITAFSALLLASSAVVLAHRGSEPNLLSRRAELSKLAARRAIRCFPR